MTAKPWLAYYDPGVPARLDYPAIPVFAFLDEGAHRCPERTCIIYKDETYKYNQVAQQTDRMAAFLKGLGVHKGERIGICMPNCPEFVLAYFAILKAGGVVVAINPLYMPREIVQQVNDAGLEKLFCSAGLYQRIQGARAETDIRLVIVSGKMKLQPQDLDFQSLIQNDASLSPTGPDPVFKSEIGAEDIALFQYTGGTTGVAKAAMVKHKNLVANTLQFKAWMSTLEEEKETFLLALPIYHIYGMVCGMLLGIALRASLAIVPDPRDIPNLLSVIQAYKVSYFPAAPTLYNAINNADMVTAGQVDLTSIKACISGSAALLQPTKEKFEKLTGGRIVEGYGLSEAPTATHCNPLQGENRSGSIGLPLPDVDAKIVNLEEGAAEMPTGQAGELIIRSPQVMAGYHNMPEETALALRDGWLYTGDIARMDGEGYFYIIDRKKELIKPGGMEVWPREVEEVIQIHPQVAEVAVAGIPDDYRGETVKAWVVLKPGENLTKATLQKWCRERLAPYKVPTEIEFRNTLPKSSVGKVLKRELREESLESRG